MHKMPDKRLSTNISNQVTSSMFCVNLICFYNSYHKYMQHNVGKFSFFSPKLVHMNHS